MDCRDCLRISVCATKGTIRCKDGLWRDEHGRDKFIILKQQEINRIIRFWKEDDHDNLSTVIDFRKLFLQGKKCGQIEK